MKLRLLANFKPLGKNWAERWVERHADKIGRYWSRTLDKKRADSVNPTNSDEWWAMYKRIVAEHGIVGENVYTADNTGFSTGQAGCE